MPRNTDPIEMPMESQDSIPHPKGSPEYRRAADSTRMARAGLKPSSIQRALKGDEIMRERENARNIKKQIARGKK